MTTTKIKVRISYSKTGGTTKFAIYLPRTFSDRRFRIAADNGNIKLVENNNGKLANSYNHGKWVAFILSQAEMSRFQFPFLCGGFHPEIVDATYSGNTIYIDRSIFSLAALSAEKMSVPEENIVHQTTSSTDRLKDALLTVNDELSAMGAEPYVVDGLVKARIHTIQEL